MLESEIMEKINIKSKLKTFSDLWSPKVIAEMNNYQFKLVKIKDDFIWHSHEDTDEVFIVLEGTMYIEFNTEIVKLSEGELLVVPKGTQHRPFAHEEARIMLVEPRGVINTGDTDSDLTAKNDQWI
jgi:mannose-6-phosphate isomerase-like protein (cupin superfamily)